MWTLANSLTRKVHFAFFAEGVELFLDVIEGRYFEDDLGMNAGGRSATTSTVAGAGSRRRRRRAYPLGS